MVRTNTIILWDFNGKIESTLFCSKRNAFNCVRVNDQMGKIAVTVSTTVNFDEERDFLVRVVSKNGQLENQLVFGTLPKWAGGTLQAPRCLLASGKDTTRLLSQLSATTWNDKEVLRQNGISNADAIRLEDEECSGK